MKTSRYRGHVLATITDRDLYYGGIGESYQVGQVLIFAAGTKPKPGSEMACADNMAAATEYLDGGDPRRDTGTRSAAGGSCTCAASALRRPPGGYRRRSEDGCRGAREGRCGAKTAYRRP